MVKGIQCAFAGVLFLFCHFCYATGYFSVTKSTSVVYPATIVVDHQAVGDYIIKNINSKARSVYINTLPSGFSQVEATGTANSCSLTRGFSLAAGASCTMRLAYTGTSAQSVDETVPVACPGSDFACEYPNGNSTFTVVANADGLPTLTAESTNVLFSLGKTTVFKVTNAGSETANNVKIILPSDVTSHLNTSSAVTSCATVAPGAVCTFTLPLNAGSDANFLTGDDEITVEGGNTASLALQAESSTSLVDVQGTTFTQPGATKSIKIVNQNAFGLSSMAVGTVPSYLTAGSTTCGSLASGESCIYNYSASSSAFGSTSFDVNYVADGDNLTLTVPIAVANPTVVINPNSEDVSQDIEGATGGVSNTFLVKNLGPFAWQSASVTHTSSDSWLTFTGNTCTGAISPDSTCQITYTINGLHDLSSEVTASGANVSSVTVNLEPSDNLSIGVEGDSAYQHLSYRAIKVSNLTQYSQELTAVTATPPSDSGVTLCNSTGSNCTSDYASTCVVGGTLSSGESCRLWYKADSSTSLQAAATNSATVSVTGVANGDSSTVSKSFNFTYGNSLYVAGRFWGTYNYEETLNNIASWDGSAWSTLEEDGDIGLSNGVTVGPTFVNALAMYKGDLYVGGNFTATGGSGRASIGGITLNRIAKWTGSTWSALSPSDQNGLNGEVRALAVYNNVLYVGGDFTETTGGTPVNRIAGWNGSAWSALTEGAAQGLNGIVRALASNDNFLYVGGDFTQTSASETLNRIGAWNGTAWSALSSNSLAGLNGLVRSLVMHDGILYAGGNFTNTTSGLTVNRIVGWNGSNWSALASNNQNGLSGSVWSLLSYGDNLYVGGTFLSSAAGTTFNRVAGWDGSDWSALTQSGSTGLNGQVSAFASDVNGVYMAGTFTTTNTGSLALSRIAHWNGSAWSALSTGLSYPVFDMLIAPHLSIQSAVQK